MTVTTYTCECVHHDGTAPTTVRYLVTGHDGSRAACRYCPGCADLARVDWNGETARCRARARGATVTRAKLARAAAGAAWRLPAARRARLEVDRACNLTARHAGLLAACAALRGDK